ncbi:MAG: T9SS type A sorting domain-containing protein, partial [Clostridiales bacterium]
DLTLKQLLVLMFFFTASSFPAANKSIGDLPSTDNNKVAYYVFDSGGPDHYSLTNFTDKANIVVLFEGTLWELADSVNYHTGWMRNVNYHYYSEILRDIKILQSRGVKVLMNVDDAASWSTSTPFTAYDGKKYDYKQFAEFIKTCAIDKLHLDGISLDIEHKATGNTEYITLLKEIGKYFGPMSSNNTSQIYTAAIYSGGVPGYVIGKSPDVAAYFNFVMDMAYFNKDYATRFNSWASYIGSSKTMIGVLNYYYDVSLACAAAAWQPASPSKAGIMVFAANNLKSYTDAVFSALTVTSVEQETKEIQFALMQNYPNPFNPSTEIKYSLPKDGFVKMKVYDLLGNEVATLVNEEKAAGTYTVNFDGSKLSSGVYMYQLTVDKHISTKKMLLIR